MKAVALLLLLLAAPAVAQTEDEAHRADRLRTQELNTRSPNGYASAPYARSNGYASATRARPAIRDRDDYQDAQAEYRRRLANWRRRVSACEAGYFDACGG